MTEFNSTSFLKELDSFGQPPPPQKILGKTSTAEIAGKLDVINKEKQGKFRDALLIPANNGMVKLGANGTRVEKHRIEADQANKWRNDVLRECRPRVSSHPVDAVSPREYSKNSEINFSSRLSDDEDYSREYPSSQQLQVKTLAHHERRSSDYSSASSTSQKSPSPPSQSSYSDYASLYKSQTVSPATISPSNMDEPHLQSFNTAFRNSGPVPVVTVDTKDRFSPISKFHESKMQRTGAAPSFGSINGLNSNTKYGTSLTQQMRLSDKPPIGRLPEPKTTNNTQQTKKWKEITERLDSDDRRLEELTKQLKKDLVMEQKHCVGNCDNCTKMIYDTEERYNVAGKTYHSHCFVCDVCGKELKEQQFYLQNDRFFCKQDYLNDQMVSKKETLCSKCHLPIAEMILTALDRNYHPSCFCCADCGCCLDGVPFSIDKNNQAYCLPDYHNRFAPRCAHCRLPITPQKDTGETVRIVALENSYHLECYVCEGCGVTLTDGPEARCYPLGKHLLCKKCHIHWASSNMEPPITDL